MEGRGFPIHAHSQVHRNKLFYCDMCDQGERGARGFAGFADAAKHVAEENGINPTDKMNIHDMMRIPKTETHLKVFRCLFCGAEGKLFVGMSEESFLEHVSKQHGAKSAMKRPHKLQRECRICNERFEADLPLTRHIKKTHIERGPQNPYPFAGFGPKEDAEEDDEVLVEVVPVEAVSSKRRTRRRSTSASDSESEDEVLEESIRRGIAKTKKKRQRLESELDRRQAAPQARQDPELIGPDTFFFVCSLCGKKDIDQFNIFEHLDEEHCLGENEAVLKQKTFRPRAVLACRYSLHFPHNFFSHNQSMESNCPCLFFASLQVLSKDVARRAFGVQIRDASPQRGQTQGGEHLREGLLQVAVQGLPIRLLHPRARTPAEEAYQDLSRVAVKGGQQDCCVENY